MSERTENVQPLRTDEEINNMILALRRGNGAYPKRPEIAERDVLLFLIGINTGLRVSDIIKLKVEDVSKDHFIIREGKTKKQREINVSMLRKEIDDYIQGKPKEEYLFKSQKGGHITTTQVYRILAGARSEEHTSELQSRGQLVCRLLLEKKKKIE